ncbi:MAG: c-type cytochrome [Myxococcota bacterium]
MKRLLIGASLSLAACQGGTFKEPPIHLNQNMDFQKKLEAQEGLGFYADGRGMRPPVEGTVAQGNLRVDEHLYEGTVDGEHARELPPKDEKGEPLALNEAFLSRGKERFGIYCTPCHAASGLGNGMAVQYGMIQPPSLHEERLQTMPIGYFYNVITYGIRNMYPYAAQIPVRDRWAIAAYVRVLQRSRAADLAQVPDDVAESKGWN